ncbi:MAG: CIA30 family protein [Tenacibaculum sp.]
MTCVILILAMLFQQPITVFNTNTQQQWYVTNDDVMGGVSTSKVTRDKGGKAIFSGNVSTQNNGGFAMMRMPVSVKFNKKYSAIKLKLKGDGKKYQFRLKSELGQRFWFVQPFQTSGKEEVITLQFSDFYASFRGYKLNIDNFSAQQITEIAVLIGNKKEESFELAIENITLQ